MNKYYLSFIILCSCNLGAASELAPTETEDAGLPPMEDAAFDVALLPVMEAGALEASADACFEVGCAPTPFGVWQCDHGKAPPLPNCSIVNGNACVDIYQCAILADAGDQ